MIFFVGINLAAYCQKDERYDNVLIVREIIVHKVNIYIEFEKNSQCIVFGEYDQNKQILNVKGFICYAGISKIATFMTIGSRIVDLLLDLLKENKLNLEKKVKEILYGKNSASNKEELENEKI